MSSKVTQYFDNIFQRRVIEDHDFYLMTELLKDVEEISKEFELKIPPIRFTRTLKEHLIPTFGESISFSMIGRKQVVHCSSLGPVTYIDAALNVHGMREDDLTKAFTRLVRRKVGNEKHSDWPPTPDQVLKLRENLKPLSCIFNAIAWSVNPESIKNDIGLVKMEKIQAQKVTALTQSWEALILCKRMPLNIAQSLTIHRLTGSKDSIKLQHRTGMGISYGDVILLTNTWTKSVNMTQKTYVPSGFTKGIPIHVTFDNSDGKQQTLTGSSTTHHTSGTVFQIVKENMEKSTIPELNKANDRMPDYGTYKIPKKRKDPQPFLDFSDDFDNSPLIEEVLKKDVAWVLISAIGVACIEELKSETAGDIEASWTNFMSKVTTCRTQKYNLKYLPVIPLPPHDNIVKWYMDLTLKMIDDLAISHAFVCAHEAIR